MWLKQSSQSESEGTPTIVQAPGTLRAGGARRQQARGDLLHAWGEPRQDAGRLPSHMGRVRA